MLSYAQAHEALVEHVSTPRLVAHSERVADEAASLASAYGVDVELARLAGLLHDWAKEDSESRLLVEAERLGLPVGPHDRVTPSLLHARVGALQVTECLPDVPREAVVAIERHTLGDVEMSDLDRVVYVADAIEPSRRYEGVEDLRTAVGAIPLSELFLRCCASSIIHVVTTRRPLHPLTVSVWNAALNGVAS